MARDQKHAEGNLYALFPEKAPEIEGGMSFDRPSPLALPADHVPPEGYVRRFVNPENLQEAKRMGYIAWPDQSVMANNPGQVLMYIHEDLQKRNRKALDEFNNAAIGQAKGAAADKIGKAFVPVGDE